MCTSSVEDGDVNLARPASPDMLREDADQPARCRQSFVEEIRANSLNRIPQVQKLRFSLSGHRPSDTSELVHRSAADLALDDRDYGPVNHRKFEGHPVSVVPYPSAPLERHRRSSIPGLTKLRPFVPRQNPRQGFVQRMPADLSRKPAFGLCSVSERAPGLQFGILRCCELAKSLSRHLPMRFVLKSQVHVHHKRVRIRRIFDPIGARFRSQLDGFEGHERSFSNDIVQKWALLLKVKLNRHLSSDPKNGNPELFFSNGFTRTDQDLPSIVHRIEQHRHFCRPISKLRRAFLDERRELKGPCPTLPSLATDHRPPVSIARRSNGVRSFLPLLPFQRRRNLAAPPGAVRPAHGSCTG